jgi:hypothetical protein
MAPTVHEEAWITALCFVALSLCLSAHLMFKHLRHFTQPPSQKHIVRILFMVPVYALDSWCALRFPTAAMYLDTVRDVYEAYVLYCFLALMIGFLGGEDSLAYLLSQKAPIKLPFPLSRMDPVQPGHRMLMILKIAVLQFVLIKPVLAMCTLLAEMFHHYEEGSFAPSGVYFWVTLFDNVSISVAFYALFVFFQLTKSDLKPYHPLSKFLAVKSVLFVTFWQGCALALLVYVGIIRGIGTWSADMVSQSLQDFLICIEMFVASVFHLVAFDYREFVSPNGEKRPLLHSARESFAMHDLWQDMQATFTGLRRGGERIREMRQFRQVPVEDSGSAMMHSTDAASNDSDAFGLQMSGSEADDNGLYYSAFPTGSTQE